MSIPLRVLSVEHSEDDALLIMRELQRGGYEPTWERVDTASALTAALARQEWDFITCDWEVPQFSAPAALKLIQEHDVDVPIIIVSGQAGEEVAVTALKAGAQDCVSKGNMRRLLPAVERELREAEKKRAHRLLEDPLRQVEQRLRSLVGSSGEGVLAYDTDLHVTLWNPGMERISGLGTAEVLGRPLLKLFPFLENVAEADALRGAVRGTASLNLEMPYNHPETGRSGYFESSHLPLRDSSGRIVGGIGVVRDVTARKQAEEALQQSQQRYRQLVEEINDIVYMIDAEAKITYISPVLERLAGYASSEVMGRYYYEFIHPADLDRSRDDLLRMLAGESVPPGEYRWMVRSREFRWMRVHSRPVVDNGRVTGFRGVLCDITERKEAEERLRESEERLRSLLENVRDFIVMLRPDGRTLYVNRTNPGIARDQVIGTAIYDHTHPDDRQIVKDAFERAVETAESVSCECRGAGYASQLYRYACCFSPIQRDGHVVAVTLVATDVTERKQMEETLRESAHELSLRDEIANIFLSVPDDEMYAEVLKVLLKATDSRYGVFGYIDERGAYVVPSMTRDIWERCQVPEKNIVFPREKWGESIWPRAIREKRTLYSNEPSTLTPEGHLPIRRNIAVPIVSGEEVIGLFQVANKETDYEEQDLRLMQTLADKIAPVLKARLERDRQEKERRRAEDEVRAHQAELAHVLRVATMGEMAAELAHEVNQPLGAIVNFARGLAARLQGGVTPREILQGVANEIASEALRAAAVIKRLRDFVGKGDAQKQPCDINGLVRDAAHLIEPEARRHTISVRHVLASGLPSVYVDDIQIEQVVVNLLRNAIEAMVEGDQGNGELVIETSVGKNGTVEVRVRDTGIGLPDGADGKMFDAFFTTKAKGLGMGLSISRSIIQRHGGQLWAVRNPDRGATVGFSLPVSDGSSTEPR